MDERLIDAINEYRPSTQTVAYVSDHPSLNIAGPTGAGKDTLATYLTQSGKYSTVVSDTTRQPRPHHDGLEVNGVHYWFVTEEVALEKAQAQAYVELKLVHQRAMYGTSVQAYERVVEAGRTPVLVIDIQGIEDLMDHFPELDSIFLLPPDFETWQRRLDGRGSMDIEEKVRRLETALVELARPLQNPRFHPVVNTEVLETAELIASEEYKSETYRADALATVTELIEKTNEFLASHRSAN